MYAYVYLNYYFPAQIQTALGSYIDTDLLLGSIFNTEWK